MNQPATVRRPATYQDVLDAPEHVVAELVRGALHLQPRPAMRHARSPSPLGVEIGARSTAGARGRRLVDPGRAGAAPGRRRAGSGSRRLATGADAADPGWPLDFDLARLGLRDAEPGDATARPDRQARHLGVAGVAHLWLVDPSARTLEAFALRDGAWVLIDALADDAEVRLAPFDAVAFPLSAL